MFEIWILIIILAITLAIIFRIAGGILYLCFYNETLTITFYIITTILLGIGLISTILMCILL